MSIELGQYGIWRHEAGLTPEMAQQIETLGYGTIWIGGSPPGDLAVTESLLAATDHIAVGTSIVNMWSTPAAEVAASYDRLEKAYPGRFLLGVGIGHPEAVQEYRSPLATIADYFDALDAAGVPKHAMALAALGPKALTLSAERSAGSLPYLTTPEHTRQARELVGSGVLIAPEQKVVLESDPETARAISRPQVDRMYLRMRNYVSNLKRLGYTDDDIADGGSDRLIDALAVHGTPDAVATGVTAHLDAGADHVCAQILTARKAGLSDRNPDPLPAMRALAEALHLS